jgi:cell division protein FtsI/penicillin-binding protein 2
MRLVGPGFIVAHVVALHAVALWFLHSRGDEAPLSANVQAPSAPADAPSAPTATPDPQAPAAPALPAAPSLRPGPLELDKVREEGDKQLADLGNGWTAELTTDVKLQHAAERVLKQGRIPMGAVVVLDAKSGDVLAMAERLDKTHPAVPAMDASGPPHLALRAVAPAASVFKIITAAALLEAGVPGDKQFCFHDAHHRITEKVIEKDDDGNKCANIGQGLAQSANGLFAKLALDNLDRNKLEAAARRFGFNTVVPFPLLTEASTIFVPHGDLELARAAAGFWHTKLTPMHGALIAAAVAGDGHLPAPQFVARLRSPTGDVVDAPRPPAFATAMSPEVAATLRKMLRETVEDGTAHRAFAHADGLDGLTVAGKTGTLSATNPNTNYTWFVGFAPADDPQVAFAVMVGNGAMWWMKATDVAREVLLAWHKEHRHADAPAVARR